jgi:hypothetical protein
MELVQKVPIMNLLKQSWTRKTKTSDCFIIKHHWEMCDVLHTL